MTRNYSFPFCNKISKKISLSVIVAEKGYDSEDNHVLVRKTIWIQLYTSKI
ncbi:MAG TPA: hypothetical protein VIY98_10800 [Nitrososphaeraceae archaeon]